MLIDTNEAPPWAVDRIRDLEREIYEWEHGIRWLDKKTGHIMHGGGCLTLDITQYDKAIDAAINEWAREIRERNRLLRKEAEP